MDGLSTTPSRAAIASLRVSITDDSLPAAYGTLNAKERRNRRLTILHLVDAAVEMDLGRLNAKVCDLEDRIRIRRATGPPKNRSSNGCA
jgi:hypothetical protein